MFCADLIRSAARTPVGREQLAPDRLYNALRNTLLALSVTATGISGQEGPVFEQILSIPLLSSGAEPSFYGVMAVEPRSGLDELYVLDWFSHSVRVFDSAGRLLREFGGRGAGPGEFSTPNRLDVIGMQVMVGDPGNRRTTWFTLDGDYAGDRTYPFVEEVRPSRRIREMALLRHGQVVAEANPVFGSIGGTQDTTRLLLLVGDDDRIRQEIASYHAGYGHAYRRSFPDFTMTANNWGSGGVWSVGGDSLLVVVDVYHGVAEWHRANRGGLALDRRRDLSWTPEPLRVEPQLADELRRLKSRGREPEDMVFVFPQYRGTFAETPVVADNGDIWLMRSWTERRPEQFTEQRLVIPYDQQAPVRELTLPENFELRSVVDDLLLGVHRGERDVETIRVYRLTRFGM